MTKNLPLKPKQKLYKIATENKLRVLGQFLVKTWSAFLYKGRQKVSIYGAGILRRGFGGFETFSGKKHQKTGCTKGGQKWDEKGSPTLH